MAKRAPVSPEAAARYDADVALAERFDDLFDQARAAEQHMQAAFAAQRAEIGPRGYDDRIYRRKAMATAPVRAWTMEAERLLTLRESHRLTGIVRLPRQPAGLPDASASPGTPLTARP